MTSKQVLAAMLEAWAAWNPDEDVGAEDDDAAFILGEVDEVFAHHDFTEAGADDAAQDVLTDAAREFVARHKGTP